MICVSSDHALLFAVLTFHHAKMLCKLTLAAVAWVNMAMATAADEDSLINSYGTFTTEPEMQFDSRTTQPCAMWYNNDGSGSCEDLVADTFLNLSTFLDWVRT